MSLSGNVRRLRDPLGNDLGGYRYTAFGEAYPADAGTPAPLIDQPLQWKARWFSPLAGGIYDVRAREWSPGLGLFMSIDEYQYDKGTALGLRGSMWSWAGQSPARYADPSGNGITACLQACFRDYKEDRKNWGSSVAAVLYRWCCESCFIAEQVCAPEGACNVGSVK